MKTLAYYQMLRSQLEGVLWPVADNITQYQQ